MHLSEGSAIARDQSGRTIAVFQRFAGNRFKTGHVINAPFCVYDCRKPPVLHGKRLHGRETLSNQPFDQLNFRADELNALFFHRRQPQKTNLLCLLRPERIDGVGGDAEIRKIRIQGFPVGIVLLQALFRKIKIFKQIFNLSILPFPQATMPAC